MIYTTRFAHLAHRPEWKVGDIIKPHDVVGVMGNTGQKIDGQPMLIHLHIDCVKGLYIHRYKLLDMENEVLEPAPRQLNYFIDDKLFDCKIVVTTYYADPEYQQLFKKVHTGYDVVPEDRKETMQHYFIFWNRSMTGKVVQVLEDVDGYGNCLYVSFEA